MEIGRLKIKKEGYRGRKLSRVKKAGILVLQMESLDVSIK